MTNNYLTILYEALELNNNFLIIIPSTTTHNNFISSITISILIKLKFHKKALTRSATHKIKFTNNKEV